MHPIRVLLVEDHPFFRESLLLLLDESPAVEVVGQAAGGEEAWRLLSNCRPTIVILDLNLPDISGLDLATRIRHSGDDPPLLLVLTGAGSPAALRTALDAGVQGYLHKESVTPERLLCALQGLCHGLVVLDPDALPGSHLTGAPIV